MTRDKTTVNSILSKKAKGERITMITAYDYPLARLADRAGVDIVFVSDALGMVGLGYKNTLPVTMEEMLHHTKAVARGAGGCFVLACLPFMSYDTISEARVNARWFLKEGGADGVELEGGREVVEIVRALVDAGVAVVAHIGLTRQVVSRSGKFRVVGKEAGEAKALFDLALELEKAGCFALLLECIPARVAQLVAQRVAIPSIGIGAGIHCDGQALVSQDLLGLFEGFVPKFVRRYANLSEQIAEAIGSFKKEVESLQFPTPAHSFDIKDEEYEKLSRLLTEAGMKEDGIA